MRFHCSLGTWPERVIVVLPGFPAGGGSAVVAPDSELVTFASGVKFVAVDWSTTVAELGFGSSSGGLIGFARRASAFAFVTRNTPASKVISSREIGSRNHSRSKPPSAA